ncbi:hypothetical protein QUB52_14835 [Microcoleus sp. A6-C6]
MTYFNLFSISMAGDQQFSVKLEDDVFLGSPGVAIDRTLPSDRAIVLVGRF